MGQESFENMVYEKVFLYDIVKKHIVKYQV